MFRPSSDVYLEYSVHELGSLAGPPRTQPTGADTPDQCCGSGSGLFGSPESGYVSQNI